MRHEYNHGKIYQSLDIFLWYEIWILIEKNLKSTNSSAVAYELFEYVFDHFVGFELEGLTTITDKKGVRQ